MADLFDVGQQLMVNDLAGRVLALQREVEHLDHERRKQKRQIQNLRNHLVAQHQFHLELSQILQEKLGIQLAVPRLDLFFPEMAEEGNRPADSDPEGRIDLDDVKGFTLKPLPED